MEVRTLSPKGRPEDLNTAGLWLGRLARIKALVGPSAGCYSVLRNDGWLCVVAVEDPSTHRWNTFAEGPSWSEVLALAEARVAAERAAAPLPQLILPLSQEEAPHVRVADDSLAVDGGRAGLVDLAEGDPPQGDAA